MTLTAPMALGLAGCGKPAPSVREQEAAQTASVATLSGWDRLFGAPQETIGAINQAGFALNKYSLANEDDFSPQGQIYVSTGQPRMFSNSNAAKPNTTSVAVTGKTAAAIDTVAYTLTLTDPVDATTARMRLAQTVGEFLGRFKIKASPDLLRAIRLGQPLDAAPAKVAIVPSTNGAPERIDVTFTRSPATNPANNKTQG
ncbi:hypothetical protein [Sphingomonas faeni]|uniref:hypothetical protein n=1 Tax=Sphingomonas faeni TaxID=185950 RepID=UPI0020C0C67B|nr:hypothetical protein [Sphingomonas faeni]MCK8457299.1 hypothetical protein [Sphingomonas faeni]